MTTRREFIKSAALASAGFAMSGITTRTNAASYTRIVGANQKVSHLGKGGRTFT